MSVLRGIRENDYGFNDNKSINQISIKPMINYYLIICSSSKEAQKVQEEIK